MKLVQQLLEDFVAVSLPALKCEQNIQSAAGFSTHLESLLILLQTGS